MKLYCRFRPGATILALLLLMGQVAATAQSLKAWPKWGFDSGNTQWNPYETVLTPDSVNPLHFGKVWERSLDGQVYAQPLYVGGLKFPYTSNLHNVVFVATEHNTVYAFDADLSKPPYDKPIWKTSLGPSVPWDWIGCGDLTPEVGITATPVIDPATNTMYVTAKTLEFGRQVWRIHALDIISGSERRGWGREIKGSVFGLGGGSVNGQIMFNPDIQLNRSALTLANGRVYFCFGSHCDFNIWEYHGWLFSYNTKNPNEPPQVWSSSPDSSGNGEAASGIWMGGAAAAVDERGDLYFITGNGPVDADLGGRNIGDSIVHIATNNGTGLFFSLAAGDYWTPSDQEWLDQVDADLGSGGLMVLPPQPQSQTPHLLAGGGKDASLRLINADAMGGFTGRIDPSTPDNSLQSVGGHGSGFWSSPGYFGSAQGGYVYTMGVGDVLKQYQLTTNLAGRSQVQFIANTATSAGYPSATPVISSNGSDPSTGLVWILNRGDGALHAFSATNVGLELYNSNYFSARDSVASMIKFTVPMVANGKVFVGSDGKLTAYGLNPVSDFQPDHYVITGPTVVNTGIPCQFQVTAMNKTNQPVPITRSVSLAVAYPNGAIKSLPPLQFYGQTHLIWTAANGIPNANGYVGPTTFIVERNKRTEATFTFIVQPYHPSGPDHFVVSVDNKVVAGVPFTFTLTAKDWNSADALYTGPVATAFTREDGTVAAGPTLTFTNQSRATGTATLATLGDSILIARGLSQFGTSVTNVVYKLRLKGKAKLGNWIGHNRLHATIRLLDPANHANVIQSNDVILGDDFSFTLPAPPGTYDVAIQVGRWLQQVKKQVNMADAENLLFAGPNGNGLLNGDTDSDNAVTQADLAAIQADLGGPSSGAHGQTDLNGDGVVDGLDLAIAQANLGKQGDP